MCSRTRKKHFVEGKWKVERKLCANGWGGGGGTKRFHGWGGGGVYMGTLRINNTIPF
jgi:hypothetical protein